MQINNYKMLSKKEIVAEFNVYNEMNRDVLHSKGASNLNSKVCISCNFFQCPAVESLINNQHKSCSIFIVKRP